jgi:transposase
MSVMRVIWRGLLHLGEIIEVEIPCVEQESARDLFRAGEACRRDLMAARNRLSKMLLRRGIVFSSRPSG